MVVTCVPDKSIEFKSVPRKALEPMVVTDSGMVNEVKPVHR